MAYSEKTLPSSITAIVIGLAPVGFAVFDRVLNGARLRATTAAGLALGAGGIALLSGGAGAAGAGMRANFIGLATAVGGCIMWSFASVLARRLKPVPAPLLNVSVQYLAAAVLLAAIAFGFEGLDRAALARGTSATWWSLGYIAVFPSLLSYTAYLWLLRNEPSARVSTYAFVNPVVAVAGGALLLGESAGPRVLAAAALVIAGTWFNFRTRSPARK